MLRPMLRIIPANTGKICGLCRTLWVVWDHPREYGENAMDWKGKLAMLGSSPRIRGKFTPRANGRFDRGIIPANTGKIFGDAIGKGRELDHPREYGENPIDGVLAEANEGSSARIRGKLLSMRLIT